MRKIIISLSIAIALLQATHVQAKSILVQLPGGKYTVENIRVYKSDNHTRLVNLYACTWDEFGNQVSCVVIGRYNPDIIITEK